MWTIRLLVVATLLGPIIAESCDVGSITLEDVTETLTITNASASQDAVVLVTFSDASSSLRIAAGTSRTSTVVGATDYAIEVLAPAQPAGNSYETYLRGIRTDLIDTRPKSRRLRGDRRVGLRQPADREFGAGPAPWVEDEPELRPRCLPKRPQPGDDCLDRSRGGRGLDAQL